MYGYCGAAHLDALFAVGTGGLANATKGGKVLTYAAKGARILDTAQNAVNVGRGIADIRENGVGLGNSFQVVSSGLGLAANMRSAVKGMGAVDDVAGAAPRRASQLAEDVSDSASRITHEQAEALYSKHSRTINSIIEGGGEIEMPKGLASSQLMPEISAELLSRVVYGEMIRLPLGNSASLRAICRPSLL